MRDHYYYKPDQEFKPTSRRGVFLFIGALFALVFFSFVSLFRYLGQSSTLVSTSPSAPNTIQITESVPDTLTKKLKNSSSPLFPKIVQNEFKLDLPVLTYHYIRVVERAEEDKLGFSLSVTPEDFRSQMQYLAAHGYHTVAPEDLVRSLKAKQPLSPKSVLLTFDDGYRDFYTAAFPILKEFNLKATLFVVPGFVGDREGHYVTWAQITEMDRSSLVTIASHTLHHVDVTRSIQAANEITNSRRTLETKLGHDVKIFAYPYGAFNEATAKIVDQAGYDLAFTTHLGTAMRYSNRFTLPRVRVAGGLTIGQFPLKLSAIPEHETQNQTFTETLPVSSATSSPRVLHP